MRHRAGVEILKIGYNGNIFGICYNRKTLKNSYNGKQGETAMTSVVKYHEPLEKRTSRKNSDVARTVTTGRKLLHAFT
jgi:hypothetical protein